MHNTNKSVIYLTIIVILYVFMSCSGEKSKDYTYKYYNIKNYIFKDTLFDKDNRIFEIDYINKYNNSWEYIKSYYANGNIQSKGFYHNSKLNGIFIGYYSQSEGRVYFKVHEKDNHLNGKAIYFYKNGRINNIKYFKMGNKVGIWKTFDSTGYLIDSTVYP